MDERPQVTCCLWASDEEIETDTQEFDCATCAVAEALEGLWPENRAAWVASRQLFTRFGYETGTIANIFERMTRAMDEDHAIEFYERLSLIFDEVCPAPPAQTESKE